MSVSSTGSSLARLSITPSTSSHDNDVMRAADFVLLLQTSERRPLDRSGHGLAGWVGLVWVAEPLLCAQTCARVRLPRVRSFDSRLQDLRLVSGLWSPLIQHLLATFGVRTLRVKLCAIWCGGAVWLGVVRRGAGIGFGRLRTALHPPSAPMHMQPALLRVGTV
jgi:hypothetical protein